MSIATTWGTTREERALPFPCDRFVEGADASYYRGVTVDAPARVVFRWLCQLRVAPYSYDWIDNFGRRSPEQLTPGLEDLVVGQRLMRYLELVEFRTNRHLTARGSSRLMLGAGAITYFVVPQGEQHTRLLVKFMIRYPRGPLGLIVRAVLPWGDLVMMRRQLLNLKRLAEATAGSERVPLDA